MSTELVKVSAAAVPVGGKPGLPALVERAGGSARFAWEEFFYAEHHNPHTQRAYLRAVLVVMSAQRFRRNDCSANLKLLSSPVSGTVSSKLFGSLHPPRGVGHCPASRSLFGRRPSPASLKAEKMLPSRLPRRPKAIAA